MTPHEGLLVSGCLACVLHCVTLHARWGRWPRQELDAHFSDLAGIPIPTLVVPPVCRTSMRIHRQKT